MERVETESKEWQALTLDDLARLKETPVGDYFTIDPSGEGVFLHDVATLQPLEQGRIPEAIIRTPELYQGLQCLQELGRDGRIVVQFVLGSHGSADDFSRMVRDHPDVLNAPLVGLEMTGNSDGSLVVSGAAGRSEFQIEQLRWAKQNDVIVLPCELQGDSNSELGNRMSRLWNDIVTPAIANRHADPLMNATAAIAERSYQAVRQWSILARLGNHLDQHAADGLLPVKERLEIPLVLGAWHAPSVERLRTISVPCEAYQTELSRRDQAYDDYGAMAMTTTLLGYAPMQFLRARLPYGG